MLTTRARRHGNLSCSHHISYRRWSVQGASRTLGALSSNAWSHVTHVCSCIFGLPLSLAGYKDCRNSGWLVSPLPSGSFFVALVFLVLCWQLCAVLCLCKVSIFYLCNLISETVSYTRVSIEPYKTTSLVQLTMPHLVSSIPSKLKLRPDITCVSEFPIVFMVTPGQNSSN